MSDQILEKITMDTARQDITISYKYRLNRLNSNIWLIGCYSDHIYIMSSVPELSHSL